MLINFQGSISRFHFRAPNSVLSEILTVFYHSSFNLIASTINRDIASNLCVYTLAEDVAKLVYGMD